MRNSWEATAAKSRADFQRCLGPLLLVADPVQHSLDGFGDLDGFTHAADLDFVRVGLGVDGTGLLRQQQERVDHNQRDDPADQERAGDDAAEQINKTRKCSSLIRC